MRPLRIALLALLGLLTGCSDDDGELKPAALPECPNLDYTACDTRATTCQQRMLALAACVYGAAEIPSIPVQLISETAFRQALEADLADARAMQSEDDIAATELMESALVDLKLVQSGALSDAGRVDSYVENLAGFYADPETGIVLIDHRTPQNDPDADALLVHEYIHALQDQDYDLETWLEPYLSFTDSLLAARSVTEGQATYYQFRVGLAMLGHAPEQVDFERTLLALRDDLELAASSDPSPYVRSASTFPYANGAIIAHRAWLADGQGFESALIANPPLSTQQVIHEVFPDDTPTVERQELDAPAATGDYVLLDEDVLGGWLLGHMLTNFGLDAAAAHDISDTWSGDHLWVYRDSGDNRAWLWQLQLSDERAAADTIGALNGELRDVVHIEHSGSRVFIASGTEGAPQELLDAGRAFLASE